MRSNGYRFTKILFQGFVFIISGLILIQILSACTSTPTLQTPLSEPTPPLFPSPPNVIVTFTEYSPLLLTPINPDIPAKIQVGPWHDNSPNCDTSGELPLVNTINIIGVEISGGIPPYTIIFEQNNVLLDRKNFPINGDGDFTKVVEVLKGYPINVTITNSEGLTLWENDLLYLQDKFNPRCLQEQ